MVANLSLSNLWKFDTVTIFFSNSPCLLFKHLATWSYLLQIVRLLMDERIYYARGWISIKVTPCGWTTTLWE
jgi:hypothetical protein